VGHVSCMGEMRSVYTKPEGKTPLEIFRCRWEDNIRVDLREIGWEIVGWIYVASDRDQWCALVNLMMNPLIP